MGYPKDIKIIDTMLGIPTHADRSDWYDSFRPLLNDQQSRDMFKMPAQYLSLIHISSPRDQRGSRMPSSA